MFGTNAIARKLAYGLNVIGEPWYTLQGEGPWAGYPAVFVRLAGCNLRCFFCDTEFEEGAVKWETAESFAPSVIAMCVKNKCKRVVITGGEPMLQEGLPALIKLLAHEYIGVQIETAGTVWPMDMDSVLANVVIVVSPKTPKVHPDVARAARAWKYIIRDGEVAEDDGLPDMNTQAGLFAVSEKRTKLARPPAHAAIYVQACDEGEASERNDTDFHTTDTNQKLAAAIAMRFGYRLSIQMHKIVGVE